MYQYPYQYQSGQSLIRVTGIDGAKAYQMMPNSTAALFDINDDIMYVKSTDGAGFPTIRTFKFTEILPVTSQEAHTDFVTRKDMEDYVKQFIQSKQATDDATDKSTANANGTTVAI